MDDEMSQTCSTMGIFGKGERTRIILKPILKKTSV
jgi:hypothetical protein